MPLNKIDSCYFKSAAERFEQGDILRDVKVIEWADREAGDINLRERTLDHCVLLTQDCDLEHDYNNRLAQEKTTNDKYLQFILLCPAYHAETLRLGEHLKDFNMKMQRLGSDDWGKLKNNNLYRYHFLERDLELQVPDLVVDFKHYLTVPRDILYRPEYMNNYLATVEIMYRDCLSSRFAHYLSRIGLHDLASA